MQALWSVGQRAEAELHPVSDLQVPLGLPQEEGDQQDRAFRRAARSAQGREGGHRREELQRPGDANGDQFLHLGNKVEVADRTFVETGGTRRQGGGHPGSPTNRQTCAQRLWL